MWIIVPVKGFAQGKRRLGECLAPRQRRGLCRAMAEDVFGALARLSAIAGVAVVTGDSEVAELAIGHGFRLVEESKPRGETAAVEAAIARLSAYGAEACAVVPGDVPLATAVEIAAALHHHGHGPAVTLVPSRDGQGTNLVAMSPVAAIPLRFGEASFSHHAEAARQAGIEPRIVRLAGLGLDIDIESDLRELMAAGRGTRAHAFLVESGIAARVESASEAVP